MAIPDNWEKKLHKSIQYTTYYIIRMWIENIGETRNRTA